MLKTRALKQALKKVIDPELGENIVDLGMVERIEWKKNGHLHLTIALTTPLCPLKETLQEQIEKTLRLTFPQSPPPVEITWGELSNDKKKALADRLMDRHIISNQLMAKIYQKNPLLRILTVMSGKGGVGKSTLTANLAIAFAEQGLKVGVIDADMYGYTLPRLVGLKGAVVIDAMTVPPLAYGVRWMSLGLFQERNLPVLWRGPMLGKTLRHFANEVYWGELDLLLIDMPPGTGDMALDVAELFPKRRYDVIVTTPEKEASYIAERAAGMSQLAKSQADVTLLGIIENMSYHICHHCGEKEALFGIGGGASVAEALNVPLLAQIPFAPRGGLYVHQPILKEAMIDLAQTLWSMIESRVQLEHIR